ncbi:hypothetical protein ALC56_14109 [Trachymyrmex septentrionalis]|uniref:Uncharacterized protein n=1 Tax=Trachymyrmex septentrionalis TaxID=34720 RepID=A0A195ETX8_9HYME|nr:hypothetical protein ALC56_14109 [Trachymyrmex septentrionalis]
MREIDNFAGMSEAAYNSHNTRLVVMKHIINRHTLHKYDYRKYINSLLKQNSSTNTIYCRSDYRKIRYYCKISINL